MKSVGEAMAIGRTFAESLQKALRSLETGLTGLDEIDDLPADPDAIRAALARPTPDRVRIAAQALRQGFPLDEVAAITRYDRWFLGEIQTILAVEAEIARDGLPADADGLRRLKAMGFSDARLAKLAGLKESAVREARRARGVRPVFKRIDTCAAEFAALTPYMYSTYESPVDGSVECESRPTDARKIIILGGGPNRIGQGIEFDYCCCHAAFALSERGFETIMVNCNPETVSTDYDTSDRLYFEPLTAEDVLEIVAKEQSAGTVVGVIVQFGGQTPLKLANTLVEAGVPILGTSADAIDLAEDRKRFQVLLNELGLKQPRNATAMTAEETIEAARAIGYPVILRPSYVLGGRGMVVVTDEVMLKATLQSGELFRISGDNPVLIDGFLHRATEVDVDAIGDGTGDVFIAGIMEHIEEAGVHSGDSACAIPPHSLAPETIAEIERQTVALARALHVRGLMNVQYAVQNRRSLRARSQSARQPHRALRRQGDRASGRRVSLARDGRRDDRLAQARKTGSAPHRRQGSRDALRALSRRRHDSRAGDALDRRSDGARREFRPRLCQKPDRRRRQAAAERHGLHLRQGSRQTVCDRTRAAFAGDGLRYHRHARDGENASGRGTGSAPRQQGARGTAARRRCDQER